jgi:thiol-disulfide isomerase/thioredoxin
MVLRLFAITVFLLMTSLSRAQTPMPTSTPGGDFASRFVIAKTLQPIPPFVFKDAKGVTHDLKDFRGDYILLNLWATWCGPCVREMPSLNMLRSKIGIQNLRIIALNEDRDIASAQAFYLRHDLKNLPIYNDDAGRVPAILQTPGLPTTFLIDRNGMEIGRIEGEADWTAPDTLAFLRARLKI